MSNIARSQVEVSAHEFAVDIIRLYQRLSGSLHEFVLSRQLLRSGTSIGANIREALHGFSRKDFLAKMYIAYKEANESCYWLELLMATDYITQEEYSRLYVKATSLSKMLSSITKTTRESLQKEE